MWARCELKSPRLKKSKTTWRSAAPKSPFLFATSLIFKEFLVAPKEAANAVFGGCLNV